MWGCGYPLPVGSWVVVSPPSWDVWQHRVLPTGKLIQACVSRGLFRVNHMKSLWLKLSLQPSWRPSKYLYSSVALGIGTAGEWNSHHKCLVRLWGPKAPGKQRLLSGRAFRQCLVGREIEYDIYAEPSILLAQSCYSIFTVFRERYYFIYLQDKRTRIKSNYKNSKGARMWSWILLTPKGMLFSQYQTWIWGAVSLRRHEWRFQCKQPPLPRDEKG